MDPNHEAVRLVDGRPTFTGVIVGNKDMIREPLRWERPEIIFAGAHMDLYQPGLSRKWLSAIFDTMTEAHWHEFNINTKFPEHARDFHGWYGGVPVNVRLGISAETQDLLDKRWAVLREIPATRYILSLQPLLEHINVPKDFHDGWVVAMSEASSRATIVDGRVRWSVGAGRTSNRRWFRSLRDQCEAIGVPFCWESMGYDSPELVRERIEQAKAGRPYVTQSNNLSLPLVN